MMETVGRLSNLFWALVVGAVALYAFFAVMGAISPVELVWLTVLVAVLGVLAAVHFIRVRRALRDHRHDEMARALHGWRERRGF
jgi:membrane protein YdbS with pleckstrin-like domain